jgi:ribonuclease E
MSRFRKKAPRVLRRGDAVEKRSVREVDGQTVTVRRFTVPEAEKTETKPQKKGSRQQQSRNKSQRSGGAKGGSRSNSGRSSANRSSSGRSSSKQNGQSSRSRGGQQRRQRPHLEVVPPPETARKQMLVRSTEHQTQLVVMEGPVLVEHYVARSDKQSLVGNVYMGKVRNVLPGMEAAFIDFGEGKNGVLYAGDVNYEEHDVTSKKPRIEMAFKPGDPVLVRVVKDAMGHKGARLANQISLSGRYLVLSTDSKVFGISRRLSDDERKRLRDLIGELRPADMGIIVRTAAEGASREDLKADIDRLVAKWKDIESKRTANAPALIYEEPPLVLQKVREVFTKDFRRLLVDDDPTLERIVTYLEDTEPDLVSRVKKYEDELPLFERFHVEDQLRKALDRKVWLPSGGHVVIDRTEALTVIDVNTGRFVGHSNLEETVLQNNLEAAEEIARQLRLRDIGGIIVIDFIDMEILKNQELVLHKFREQLAKDKRRTQVFEVSSLGLVEMTRKNVSEGLLESFSEVCTTCSGRGVVLYENAATQGVALPGTVEEALADAE